MATVKMFHVLFVFIWIGNLLGLTRLMGYHVKEDENTQKRMALLYRRMYNFVGLPCMIISLTLGSILVMRVDQNEGLLWFFHKVAFAIGLVVCDVICGSYINKLVEKTDHGRGIRYKVLHGLTGLFLIGIMFSLYFLRTKVNIM